MPLVPPKPLPPSLQVPIAMADKATGAVSMPQMWQEYFASMDAAVRQLAAAQILTLFNAVNDAAAAAGGVKIGGLYRNGNAVQIRLV